MTLSKNEARKMIKLRLANLDNEAYFAKSVVVYKLVLSFLSEHRRDIEPKSVLLYQAAPVWREVDLSSVAKAFPDTKFDCLPIDAKAKMPEAKYDIIFVPLYGFNAEYFRLGHGSGWYDRFLALQPRALKIGVGFELGQVNFKTDFHDIRLDKIITDYRTF